MKILAFLIFIVLVVSGLIWYTRASKKQAELARKLKFEQRKLRNQQREAVTPHSHVKWPTVGLPVAGPDSVAGDGGPDHPEEEKKVEEPAMKTIEFVPPEQISS